MPAQVVEVAQAVVDEQFVNGLTANAAEGLVIGLKPIVRTSLAAVVTRRRSNARCPVRGGQGRRFDSGTGHILRVSHLTCRIVIKLRYGLVTLRSLAKAERLLSSRPKSCSEPESHLHGFVQQHTKNCSTAIATKV
jgi:hypothetical protein